MVHRVSSWLTIANPGPSWLQSTITANIHHCCATHESPMYLIAPHVPPWLLISHHDSSYPSWLVWVLIASLAHHVSSWLLIHVMESSSCTVVHCACHDASALRATASQKRKARSFLTRDGLMCAQWCCVWCVVVPLYCCTYDHQTHWFVVFQFYCCTWSPNTCIVNMLSAYVGRWLSLRCVDCHLLLFVHLSKRIHLESTWGLVAIMFYFWLYNMVHGHVCL